jgi:hypothetical protein
MVLRSYYGLDMEVPHAAFDMPAAASTRRRVEAAVRLSGVVACLAAVVAAAVWVGAQGGAQRADVLLGGLRAELQASLGVSHNPYVADRVAEHRAERIQELNELERETQEKRQRKEQLQAQETREIEDEDKMANRQLDRYNDIYTASTPEEAAMEASQPEVDPAADATLDQRLDQYDAPILTVAQAYGRAGMTAYNGGVPTALASVVTQNLAEASPETRPKSVQGLVSTISQDLTAVENRLDSSAAMQDQRGSRELKDILDSSMLQIKGLAKRVGAHMRAATPLRLSQPEAAATHTSAAADSYPAAPTPVAPVAVHAVMQAARAVVQQQAQIADDRRIQTDKRQYPSMQSMIRKYKAWMEAKKSVEETGMDPNTKLKGVETQGLTSVPHGKPKLAALPLSVCARINSAHAGDTAARENVCANTAACHYDFGYQLCLQKK